MTAQTTKTTLVVVDDDPEMVSMLSDVLGEAGYRVVATGSGIEALKAVQRESPDLLISDLRMVGMSGHEVQRELRKIAPNLAVIVITGFGSIQTAVESMRLGAFDYITKPFSNDELLMVVDRALQDCELKSEVRRLREEIAQRSGLENIIAASPKMLEQIEFLKQVADTQASVLITGESGVGKDLFARALHYYYRLVGCAPSSSIAAAPL
jgi:DNA-binding NtrC family response regulator